MTHWWRAYDDAIQPPPEAAQAFGCPSSRLAPFDWAKSLMRWCPVRD